jgi:hypothetical protein
MKNLSPLITPMNFTMSRNKTANPLPPAGREDIFCGFSHALVHFGLHACPLSMPIDASLCRLPFSPQISRFCLSGKCAAPETRRRRGIRLGVTVGIAVCDATLRRNADHRLPFHADMNEKSFAAAHSLIAHRLRADATKFSFRHGRKMASLFLFSSFLR